MGIFQVLIAEKRLYTPPEVMKEIKHPDHIDTSEAWRRLKRREREVSFRKNRDQWFHDILGDLQSRFPQLCKSRSTTKRPGDPYVIATAKRCGFIVIGRNPSETPESEDSGCLCVHTGVKCFTLNELMAAERTLFDP